MKKILSVIIAVVAITLVVILAYFCMGKKAEAPMTDNKVVAATTPEVIYVTPEPTLEPTVEPTPTPTPVVEETTEDSTFVLNEVEFYTVIEENGINAIHVFGDESLVVAEAANWDWATWAWLLQANYENSSVWQHVSVCEAIADGSYMENNARKALVESYAINGGMDIIRANGKFVATKVGEQVKRDAITTKVNGISDNGANDYFTTTDCGRWVLVDTHVSDMVYTIADVNGTLKRSAGFVREDRLGESIGLQKVADGEYRVVVYTTAGTVAKQASQPVVAPTMAPTSKPTSKPTQEPTQAPTVKPTGTPAHEPEATLPPKEGYVSRDEQETNPAHEVEPTLPPKQGTVTRDEQESKPTSQATVKPTQAPVTEPNTNAAHAAEVVIPDVGKSSSGKTTTTPTQKPAEVAPAHQEEQPLPKMGGVTF